MPEIPASNWDGRVTRLPRLFGTGDEEGTFGGEYEALENLGPKVRRALAHTRGKWSSIDTRRYIDKCGKDPDDPKVDADMAKYIIRLDRGRFPGH